MKRDDFKEFAVKLRGKNNNYRQMKKVLGEIKAEVNVLTRTEAILKGKASNLDEFYKNIEKEHGVEGYGNVAERMEDLAENQQKMDSKKDETLQEITKIVTEIEG
jgi:septation ring formation regulator EzrA